MDSRTLIDAQFDRAVEIIQNLPKTGPIQTGYEEKLTMYSLYKQATVGNVKSPRPGMWDMLGRAKWDAWAKHKDLDSYDAKWRYVDALLKVLRKYSDKTMARDLVRELESFGGDPANLVHSMALSRSLDSDSSSSDGHATGSGYRSAHLSSYAQGNPDVQDEDGTSEEETSDEEEIGPIAPPLVEQNTVSDRPQSSFSSHRYRTPVASATLGPTPVIPASQPQPGFETPSAFAGPSSASLSSYPPQYAEQAITQDLVSPPSQSIYRRPPSARPHALSAAGFPPRPSSQLALERAIESVQAQLAALSERMEIIESHSFASRPFASPGASRSSSAFAGRRSPCSTAFIPGYLLHTLRPWYYQDGVEEDGYPQAGDKYGVPGIVVGYHGEDSSAGYGRSWGLNSGVASCLGTFVRIDPRPPLLDILLRRVESDPRKKLEKVKLVIIRWLRLGYLTLSQRRLQAIWCSDLVLRSRYLILTLSPYNAHARSWGTTSSPGWLNSSSIANIMASVVDLSIPKSNSKISVNTGLFINNEFVPSVDNLEPLKVYNPSTEEVLCTVTAASEKDVDIAVAAARKAFRETWGKNVTGFERSRLINKLADLIERDQQILAELECLNNGKPVKIARDFDIGDSVGCLRYYAGWADKILGQSIEVDHKTKIAITHPEPIGVCGQIIPWNYPIQMWAWKVAPALAVGCTIVMKPSEITPLTALKLSELVKEAGFPAGVVNTIPSLGSVGGAALAAHRGVDKVAFTGSTITGRKVLAAAASSNLKKVSLELGGKSPHLVFESADIEQAANWAALGILYNTGQDCTAGSRLYVQDTIYDKFVTVLAAKARELTIGDGFDEKSGGGPVVSRAQYDRVWSYIESGKKEGAKVIVGGEKRATPGYWVDATIFTDIRPDMKIVKEEIFGPVLSVGKFHTEQEAIDLANDTTYGLAAGLHSTDQAQCHRVSSALEAGTVWVNQYNVLYNNVPFGGKKQSGIGRELGSHALDEYISTKAVHWNYGEKLEWPL